MEDPRIISALFISLKMAYYNVLINSLPSAGARQSNGNSRYPYRIRIAVNLEQK